MRTALFGRVGKITIAAALLGLLAIASASSWGVAEGITETGRNVTRQYDFASFDSLVVSQAFQADIRQGSDYQVTVEIDEAFAPYLVVQQTFSGLRVGLESGHSYNMRNNRPHLTVTLPRLVSLELSGAVVANVRGFRSADALRLRLSGASSVSGDMTTGDIDAELSGASQVRLKGSGADARLTGSGTSFFDLADYPMRNVSITLGGASNATIQPSGKLDVETSGASHVVYIGNPTMGRMSTSGASTISSR